MRAATLVLFACALAVGVLGKMPSEPERAEMMKKCITESGLDESAKKDIFIMPEGEPSQKIKCFHACMSREMGVMVDGNINKDKAIEMIPADFLEREKNVEVLSKCSEKKGSDDCETAYLVFKCLRDNKMIPPPPPRPE
ncbi:general odorant-binding protein 56h-like isoform X1 [Cotesia glomerata]|uniref:general odorant-binding protein 56h-like isoform X1 n=1 Tax=Cotesia glomerata TaxID=32391 RepID=UPI001D033E6C|nr:general odorant-binding protein 56h-like isoform X1 [Cotesia glomerata]